MKERERERRRLLFFTYFVFGYFTCFESLVDRSFRVSPSLDLVITEHCFKESSLPLLNASHALLPTFRVKVCALTHTHKHSTPFFCVYFFCCCCCCSRSSCQRRRCFFTVPAANRQPVTSSVLIEERRASFHNINTDAKASGHGTIL